jgi:hypothetical protein
MLAALTAPLLLKPSSNAVAAFAGCLPVWNFTELGHFALLPMELLYGWAVNRIL